jgi:hypothetical protein
MYDFSKFEDIPAMDLKVGDVWSPRVSGYGYRRVVAVETEVEGQRRIHSEWVSLNANSFCTWFRHGEIVRKYLPA